MQIRDLRPGDWQHVWPFFDEIVADGETYAYPPGLTSEAARALWVQPPPHRTVVAVDGDTVLAAPTMAPTAPVPGSKSAPAASLLPPPRRGRAVARRLAKKFFAWGG